VLIDVTISRYNSLGIIVRLKSNNLTHLFIEEMIDIKQELLKMLKPCFNRESSLVYTEK
jgi:hypothetical protein